MRNYNRGLLLIFIVTVVFVTGTTLLYQAGMTYLENNPRSLMESLQFVTQTMTTVGYGEDAPWNHQAMYFLVILTQLGGIAIVFLSIPIVVTPWMEERFALRPPTEYSSRDHIIITPYSELQSSFIDELVSLDVPYLILDNRESVARNHYQEGRSIMLGDAEQTDDLRKASLEQAEAVILDAEDQQIATSALAIQEIDSDLTIVAIPNTPDHEVHLRAAGVDELVFPRRQIGTILGERALLTAGHTPDESREDSGLIIEEFPLPHDNDYIHKDLRTANIRNRTGANIIGCWRGGEFIHRITPTLELKPYDVLVAAGSSRELSNLGDMLYPRHMNGEELDVVIIGYGNEGKAAHERLDSYDIEPVIVDSQDRPAADYVGNGMNSELLQKAGVPDADIVIVTISHDDAAIMVTLMVRELNPEAQLLVQVNQISSIEPVYRARASYVQSLCQVTGRRLADLVLGEPVFNPELNVSIKKVPGRLFDGQTLESLSKQDSFYLSIIGIETDEEITTNLDPEYEFNHEDEIYVGGTDEDVNEFEQYNNLSTYSRNNQ